MSRKKIVLLAACSIILVTAFYAYKEYTRKKPNLHSVSSAYEITDSLLINEFIKNEQFSNSKYLGKIVSVTGQVKQLDKDGNTVTIVLGSMHNASSVKCAMDSTEKTANVQLSETITVKGACIGFNKDDLIGSDVILNRCVLINQ